MENQNTALYGLNKRQAEEIIQKLQEMLESAKYADRPVFSVRIDDCYRVHVSGAWME